MCVVLARLSLKMRRGHLQRLRAGDAHVGGEGVGRSELCNVLLEQWAWGGLAAQNVQIIAQAAVVDGAQHPHVHLLALLGSNGVHPGHCRRDLLQRCFREGELPHITLVDAPMLDANWEVVQSPVGVLLPSEVLCWMWARKRERFMDMLGAGLREFWSQVRPDDPKLVGHPMCGREGWQDYAIPLVLHCNSVQYGSRNQQKSIMVLSFSPLFARGHVWDTHLLMAAISKFARTSDDDVETLDVVMGALVEDFGLLFAGCRQDLSQLFDGYFFVVWVICGDLEFFSNELKMPHFNSNHPCWLCGANRSNLNIRDVSREAGWKETLNNAQTAPSHHGLWLIPGLHRHHCPGDAMHIVDCNGVAHFLLGSVLWQLAVEQGEGNDMDDKVQHILGQMPR